MSETNYHNKEKKKTKALFSVVCLCIIALGLIVYFSTSSKTAQKKNPVNENQTLEVTTDVQRAVTVKESTKSQKKQKTSAKAETGKSERAKTEKSKKEAPTMQPGKNNTPYKSFYKYPLTEEIVKGYTQELVYDSTMGDYRAHPAVDFKGNEGDDVVAVNDGLVLNVYTDNMLGIVVEIDHGSKFVAKYCGLQSASVKKGSYVNIGNKIGTLGKVPEESAQETHLHFSATLDGKPVNPLDVMGKTE